MVAIYVRAIQNGTKTIEDVPARWRDEVEKALASNTEKE